MYYHVIVELDEKHHKSARDRIEIKSDITNLDDVINKYSEPYQTGAPILINGRTIPIEHIERLRVFSSEISGTTLKQQYASKRRAKEQASSVAFIGFYSNDLESAIYEQTEITEDLITYAKGTKKEKLNMTVEHKKVTPSKVFIVP